MPLPKSFCITQKSLQLLPFLGFPIFFKESDRSATGLNVRGFHGESVVRTPPAMQELQEMWVPSLGREDLLEKGMATPQYSCLENPRTEEPGGLQSIGSQSQTRLSNLACILNIV